MTHSLLATSVLLAALLVAAGIRFWPALRPSPVPIEVILGDQGQRRRWRRLISGAVRRLRRLVGASPGASLALLVTEWLPDGQRATCVPARRRADGRTVHLVSLALNVPERRLTPDEVLAALAEQYLALTLASRPKAGRVPASPPAPAADQVGALLRDLGVARNGRGE
ncbi:MAG: hypothetical protein ACR2JY_20370 [Chloroflexota bacterium]